MVTGPARRAHLASSVSCCRWRLRLARLAASGLSSVVELVPAPRCLRRDPGISTSARCTNPALTRDGCGAPCPTEGPDVGLRISPHTFSAAGQKGVTK